MWVIRVFSADRRRPIVGQDPGDLLAQGLARRPWCPRPSGTSRPRTGPAGSWADPDGGAWPVASGVDAGPPGAWAMCSSRTDRATLLSNGDRIEPCGVPASVSRSTPILAEDARLQERLHQGQDAFVPDASRAPGP